MFNNENPPNFQKVKNLAFILIVLLFLISGCRSSQLKTLESLIPTDQITTGQEVSIYIQDTEWGITGPIYAEVFIEYGPIGNYTKIDLYDEIIDILIKNNWEEEVCNGCDYGFFSASLHQDNYPIPINVKVHIKSDKNIVSIRMQHPKP